MSHNKKFDDHLLQEKKDKFVEATVKATALLQLPTPKINFSDCSEFEYNQLAHYHPGENKVCVSKHGLIGMDYDAIFDTATHEVTHMLVGDHDSEFHRIQGNVNTAIWEPPKGLGIVYDNPYDKRKIKLKPKKVRKGECGYHLCHKDAKSKCSFCEKSFCHKHVRARQAGMTKIGSSDLKEILRADSLKSSEGHPCFQFEEEPSPYEARGLDVYSDDFFVESVLVKQDGDSIIKALEKEATKKIKKKKRSKPKSVTSEKTVLIKFEGRPLKNKIEETETKAESISEDVIGFWEWLKSLLKK